MLLQNLRARIGARLNGDKEAGFTLIELLVVMLIIGILAAIALPAFFNQKEKAGDSKAKEYVHTAQVAMETCATEHGNSYKECDQEALHVIEPTIPKATVEPKYFTIAPSQTENAYKITVKAEGGEGHTFTLERNKEGELTYSCTVGGKGGCPTGGNWNQG